MLVAYTYPGRTWLLTGTVTDPAALLDLDWAAVAAGDLDATRASLPGLSVSSDPVLLVCTNGTIDHDHYRQAAMMLRQATRTDFVRGLARLVRPLAAAAIILLAISVMPRDAPPRQDAIAMSPVMSPATTQVK